MRIAYVVFHEGGPQDGVSQKIVMQVRSWQDLDIDARLVIVAPSRYQEFWTRTLPQTTVVPRGSGSSQRAKIHAFRSASKLGPDVIYHREPMPNLASLGVRRTVPLVLEVNADLPATARHQGLAPGLVGRLGRSAMLHRSDAFVAVTNELARQLPQDRPVCVVGNSIEIPTSAARPYRNEFQDSRPVLAMLVSNDAPWQGIDRLVRLATVSPDWSFRVVGLDNWVGAPPNVEFLGKLDPDGCRQVLQSSDIGIGSLGAHRNGMGEACTLKVRSYMAAGLPTIMSYHDTDFLNGADFILELPAYEFDIATAREEIRHFVNRWRGERIDLELVRHLDVRVKEQKRIEFVRTVAALGHTHRGRTVR